MSRIFPKVKANDHLIFGRVILEPSGGHMLEICTYESNASMYFNAEQLAALERAIVHYRQITSADDGGFATGHERLNRKVVPLVLNGMGEIS